MKPSILLLAGLTGLASLPELCRKPPPEPTTHQLPEKERASAKKKLEAARAKAPAMDLAHRDFGHDLREANLVPRPDLGPCPVPAASIVPEDPSTGTTRSARLSLANKRNTRVLAMTELYKPLELTPEDADKTPATAALDAILESLGPAVTGGSWASADVMNARVDKELAAWEAGHDLTFITRVYDPPEVITPDTFTTLRLVGTLYLFSRAQKKFVCGVDLDGKTAPKPIPDVEPDFLVSPIVNALPRLSLLGPIDTRPPDAGASDAGKKKRR